MSNSPRNAIETAIAKLQHAAVPGGKEAGLIGCEWWVQRRPENSFMEFHFDTDMCTLHKDQVFRCPSLSSILYLTSPASGGPTVILDQEVCEGFFYGLKVKPATAEEVDFVYPHPGRFCVFQGNLTLLP